MNVPKKPAGRRLAKRPSAASSSPFCIDSPARLEKGPDAALPLPVVRGALLVGYNRDKEVR